MWQTMDKEELEKQYNSTLWVKRIPPGDVIDDHVQKINTMSTAVANEIPRLADIRYGNTDVENLDIFAPDDLPKDAPIFIYLHGGYWQLLSKNNFLFLGESFTKAGAPVVVVEYELAPKATMEEIIAQCRAATKYVLEWAADRGSRGVYLCGHSAGGHLVAMLMTYNWKSDLGDKIGSLLKGVIPMSGVFDVRPLVNTYVNKPLKLTMESAWDNSPNKYLETIGDLAVNNSIAVLVAIAEYDSPEFHRQSQEFHDALKSKGVETKYVNAPEEDHFTLAELLSNPDFILTKEIFKFMKLV